MAPSSTTQFCFEKPTAPPAASNPKPSRMYWRLRSVLICESHSGSIRSINSPPSASTPSPASCGPGGACAAGVGRGQGGEDRHEAHRDASVHSCIVVPFPCGKRMLASPGPSAGAGAPPARRRDAAESAGAAFPPLRGFVRRVTLSHRRWVLGVPARIAHHHGSLWPDRNGPVFWVALPGLYMLRLRAFRPSVGGPKDHMRKRPIGVNLGRRTT